MFLLVKDSSLAVDCISTCPNTWLNRRISHPRRITKKSTSRVRIVDCRSMDFSDHNSFDRGEKKISQQEMHTICCWKGVLNLFQEMQTESIGNKDQQTSRVRKTVNLSSFSLLAFQELMTNGRLCGGNRIAVIFLGRNRGCVFFSRKNLFKFSFLETHRWKCCVLNKLKFDERMENIQTLLEIFCEENASYCRSLHFV